MVRRSESGGESPVEATASIAMLPMILGPSMKPVWAPDEEERAFGEYQIFQMTEFAPNATTENPIQLKWRLCVLPGVGLDREEDIAYIRVPRHNSQGRATCRAIVLLPVSHLGLTHDLQTVGDRLNAGVRPPAHGISPEEDRHDSDQANGLHVCRDFTMGIVLCYNTPALDRWVPIP